jgi:ring-1,2-phenylacetyl-CoA epoxidase subunit PaaD
MSNSSNASIAYDEPKIWAYIREVTDPEIPVLNIEEMGIAREVRIDEQGHVTVRITPTYSGCPAMQAIEMAIRAKLLEKGLTKDQFTVDKDYKEAWTTDWMTNEAKAKLKEYGIAPPTHRAADPEIAFKPMSEREVSCPHCDSTNTRLQSEFGSTACKAQFYCDDCHQPFEYFKCH